LSTAVNSRERAGAFRRRPHPLLRTQVKYGLLFNDDPKGYLFPKTPGNPDGYRATDAGGTNVNGIKWMEKFGLVVAKMKRIDILDLEKKGGFFLRRRAAREIPKLQEELEADILWASHFGDLQYLHAMGLADDSREKIREKMRQYAEHAWSAATEEGYFEELQTEIKSAKQAALEGADPSDRRSQLLARFDGSDALYHTEGSEDFQYRALGSIIHMVQDSYAKGHAVRERWDGENSGRILYFQNYAEQDGDKHGAFDTHPSKDTKNWSQIPGATKAMAQSSILITYFKLQCGWQPAATQHAYCPPTGVEGFLFDEVFETAPLPDAEKATRSHPEIRQAP
jgi:hypothetical protein